MSLQQDRLVLDWKNAIDPNLKRQQNEYLAKLSAPLKSVFIRNPLSDFEFVGAGEGTQLCKG